VSFGVLSAGSASLIFYSLLWAAVLALARLPWLRLLKDFKGWMIFLAVIFVLKAAFSPGPRLPGLEWLPVSLEGLRLGGLTCWRLALILAYAMVFTAVSAPREVRNVVSWILKPLPFIPERRAALMVSIVLHFLPLILDELEEIRLAIKARLGEGRKNPVARARLVGLPLLRRSLARSDDLAMAVVARGYRDDVAVKTPPLPGRHLLYLVLVALLLLLGIIAF
jgi:energy-coupling factor transporter transmembrane protein EcfT